MVQSQSKVKLDPALIEGFQKAYLLDRFDNPVPPGQVHKEMWELFCSDHSRVAMAAPRAHAKSTGVTHTCVLASVLFRVNDFVLIVSDTEGAAAKFLHDITVELQENDDIKRDFRIAKWEKDSSTEIEVVFADGARFCIVVKGGEQNVRGIKWRGKRPNLIVIDDAENDESVENPERRAKFKNWILYALIPCGSKNCKVRIVGTILHDAGFLEGVLRDTSWLSKRFRAHKSFDDFSEILWPEQYDEAFFRQKRQEAINQGTPEGYSKEYLNDPVPAGQAVFDCENIKPYDHSAYSAKKNYYCTTDFAVSTKQRADRSVFLVFSVNVHGVVTVEEVVKGRFDPEELVTQWFLLHKKYKDSNREIQFYVVEEGTIKKAIGPYLNDRMLRENVFLDLMAILPTTDKLKRSKAIQGRVRAGGVRANKDSDWWADFEHELARFPSGQHDDQVDAFSLIGLVLDKLIDAPTQEDEDEEEYRRQKLTDNQGRNAVTGY
jgi:predicted phage terminase large subunit-like protein